MKDTNVFTLARIIKAAGTDPSDVTDAVWDAGYRRPERSTEKEVSLALEQIKTLFSFNVPEHVWPVTIHHVLKGELNEIIEEALWCDERTSQQLAMILINQFHYSKVPTDGAA